MDFEPLWQIEGFNASGFHDETMQNLCECLSFAYMFVDLATFSYSEPLNVSLSNLHFFWKNGWEGLETKHTGVNIC